MARIKYKGKKTNFQIPFPSGEKIVNPGDVFEIAGSDLKHMMNVMEIQKQHCDGPAGWDFIPADEYEILVESGKWTEAGNSEIETESKDLKEEIVSDISALSYPELKKLAKQKGIKAGRVSKEELLNLLKNMGENQDEKDNQIQE